MVGKTDKTYNYVRIFSRSNESALGNLLADALRQYTGDVYKRQVETTTGPLGAGMGMAVGMAMAESHPVSYTHLDVYKRQIYSFRRFSQITKPAIRKRTGITIINSALHNPADVTIL